MNEDKAFPRLAEGLRRLAEENAAVSPPADLEKRTLNEVLAATMAQRRPSWLPACAAAMAVLAPALLLLRNEPASFGRAAGGHLRRLSAPASEETAKGASRAIDSRKRPFHPPHQPFMLIPYVAPPAPYERLAIVRQNLPVAALIAAGLRVQAPDVGVVLKTEILVGQDGRPLALRLVAGSALD